MIPRGAARRLGLEAADTAGGLFGFVACFAGYVVLDVLTRALARPDPDDLGRLPLAAASVRDNPLPAAVLVALVVGAAVRDPRRLLAPWTGLEQGRALRLLAVPVLTVLTWQAALRPYDFLLDTDSAVDRTLLVVLAGVALVRPVALGPFVAQYRILAAPLAFPFDSVQGQNIDELLVIALAALAAAQLVNAATRSDDTSPVVAVIAAALVSHFFVPGRLKLANGWLGGNDLAHLPINANTVGWRGHADGSLAETLADLLRALGPVARVAALVVEIGAIIAVVHHRVLRWWLPAAIVFHLVNFVIIGYWFLGWVVLEAALLVVLWRARNHDWLGRNLTPGRAAITGIAVLAGPWLFHPPLLAWFDTPVADGHRIEATGESGTVYQVPFEALAPFDQDLAFGHLVLGERHGVSGPYGVVGTAAEVEPLTGLTDLGAVDDLRAPLDDRGEADRQRAEDFLAIWARIANQRALDAGPGFDRFRSLAAPDWFWTSVEGLVYDFQEPIGRLTVRRVTSLITDDGVERGATTVLVMEIADDGTVSVIDREASP